MVTILFSLDPTAQASSTVKRVIRELAPKFLDKMFPDTRAPTLANRYFLSLDEDADVAAHVDRLKQIPGVAQVELPPRRSLTGS